MVRFLKWLARVLGLAASTLVVVFIGWSATYEWFDSPICLFVGLGLGFYICSRGWKYPVGSIWIRTVATVIIGCAVLITLQEFAPSLPLVGGCILAFMVWSRSPRS